MTAAAIAIGRGLARGQRSSWRAALLVVPVYVALHVAIALAPSSDAPAPDGWYGSWLGPIPLHLTWAVVLGIHRHRYRDRGDASC